MCDGEKKTDILSLSEDELKAYLKESGFPAYRGGQVFGWLHGRQVMDFPEMNNVPKDVRNFLQEKSFLADPKIKRHQVSQIDGTEKFLFEYEDGSHVESVLMKHDYGNSVCVSSQVGCAMGCAFCASTIDGCRRNLSTGEILSEVYAINRLLSENDGRISHIVVMGTGEPLVNYDNVLGFINRLSDEGGLNISKRNITISTCGIVPGIRRLAEEGLPITLALSLHSAIQQKREGIMPIAKKYDLDEVVDACRYYFDKTGRRITLEYAMIRDYNDSPEDAKALSKVAKTLSAHVNLIPLNEVEESRFSPTTPQTMNIFFDKLAKSKINVTIRKSMGADIDGACGQLRMKERTTT